MTASKMAKKPNTDSFFVQPTEMTKAKSLNTRQKLIKLVISENRHGKTMLPDQGPLGVVQQTRWLQDDDEIHCRRYTDLKNKQTKNLSVNLAFPINVMPFTVVKKVSKFLSSSSDLIFKVSK